MLQRIFSKNWNFIVQSACTSDVLSHMRVQGAVQVLSIEVGFTCLSGVNIISIWLMRNNSLASIELSCLPGSPDGRKQGPHSGHLLVATFY
jgi:hypothetical protein